MNTCPLLLAGLSVVVMFTKINLHYSHFLWQYLIKYITSIIELSPLQWSEVFAVSLMKTALITKNTANVATTICYNSASHTASLAACDIGMAKCALSIQNKNYAQLGTLSLYIFTFKYKH